MSQELIQPVLQQQKQSNQGNRATMSKFLLAESARNNNSSMGTYAQTQKNG
jgi:hypothetical protein